MSKIPEKILQAGCSAYCAKFLHGRGALGEAIEDAYFAINYHKDWVEAGPKAWGGEGLPPVGVMCEVTTNDGYNWRPVKILFSDEFIVLIGETEGKTDRKLLRRCDADVSYRPIRTPEQIAEEARLAELNEMVRNVKDHPRGRHGADHLTQLRIQEEACIDLYDAGYRKQEAP